MQSWPADPRRPRPALLPFLVLCLFAFCLLPFAAVPAILVFTRSTSCVNSILILLVRNPYARHPAFLHWVIVPYFSLHTVSKLYLSVSVRAEVKMAVCCRCHRCLSCHRDIYKRSSVTLCARKPANGCPNSAKSTSDALVDCTSVIVVRLRGMTECCITVHLYIAHSMSSRIFCTYRKYRMQYVK